MRNRRIRVKPGRTQSMLGMIVGIIFVGIGCFIVIPTFGPFGIFWTLIAVAITVTNGLNAFGKNGVTSHEIVISDDYITESIENSPSDEENMSPEARLSRLQGLYDRRPITTEEYEEKRREIISQL